MEPRGDEVEDAAELGQRHEQVVADARQDRRADVVERQHQTLVFADQALGREAGREVPEGGPEEAFDAAAKWGGKHIDRSHFWATCPESVKQALANKPPGSRKPD